VIIIDGRPKQADMIIHHQRFTVLQSRQLDDQIITIS